MLFCSCSYSTSLIAFLLSLGETSLLLASSLIQKRAFRDNFKLSLVSDCLYFILIVLCVVLLLGCFSFFHWPRLNYFVRFIKL